MALTNEWTEHHLTPRGWERGSEKDDFQGLIERLVPPDRVMTTTFKEYASSRHQPMERSGGVSWTSPDKAALQALLHQFGPGPEHL